MLSIPLLASLPFTFSWGCLVFWGALNFRSFADLDLRLLLEAFPGKGLGLKTQRVKPSVTPPRRSNLRSAKMSRYTGKTVKELPLGCPRSTVNRKAPRATRAVRGNTLETVPFQPYFGCTESFLKVLSNRYFQATRPVRAKQAVTVPSQPYFGFH